MGVGLPPDTPGPQWATSLLLLLLVQLVLPGLQSALLGPWAYTLRAQHPRSLNPDQRSACWCGVCPMCPNCLRTAVQQSVQQQMKRWMLLC